MDICRKLKDRRKELGLTMLEVARQIGVSEATVSRWESGDIANMRRDKIVSLAKALQVHPSFIMGEEEYPENKTTDKYPPPNITEDYTTFPVFADIAAGYESVAIEDWDGEVIDVPNSYLKGHDEKEFVVLRVKGSSMYPTYHDGDKVLVLKQTTLNYSGQVGAVLYDDEYATLKRVEYVTGEDWMRLVPINANYEPELIEGERLTRCRVIGIPKLLIRDIGK